jgi:hypothetical protein
MAYSTLSDSIIEVGDAVKREIFTTIRSNQEDHESRISSVESSGSRIIVFNKIIDLASYYRTGDVKWSFLTLSQFQAKYGTEWVQIAGQSISGTDLEALYGSTLPDFRNRFPRITDESTRTIGSTEANQNKTHTHIERIKFDGGNETLIDNSDTGTTDGSYVTPSGTATDKQPISTASDGGSEARPDSGVLSAFIRKNDLTLSQIELYEAGASFNLIKATVRNLTAGTSGTLEIDLLKGSYGSGTTVFSTKPSVTSAAGNGAVSSNAAFSSTSVSVGDLLQLDLTSIQTNQSRFHVVIEGEPT